MSKKISVMLIDDNKIDLFIHNEFLKQMNITNGITEYQFATEALEFLKNSNSEKWPELILLDIHMPIMNGFDFLSNYSYLPKQNQEKCNILIVSSSLDAGDISRAKENPLVLGLIEKPMNTDKLKNILLDNKII